MEKFLSFLIALVAGIAAAIVFVLVAHQISPFVPEKFSGLFSLIRVLLALGIFAWVGYLIVRPKIVFVPENEVWLTEQFGAFNDELEAGLNILGIFEKVDVAVFVGQQVMDLNLDDAAGHGRGNVEFKDCSAGVYVSLIFQVSDAEQAAYSTNDLQRLIGDVVESAVRADLSMYTLDQAMNLKGRFNKEAVALMVDLNGNPDPRQLAIDYPNSELYHRLDDVGVKLISLMVADFILPEEISEQRQKKLVAEQSLAVSEINLKETGVQAKITEKKARADGNATRLRGKGSNDVLKETLTNIGATGRDAITVATTFRRCEAIEKAGAAGNLIIVEGEDRQVGAGAKFGAGSNAAARQAAGRNQQNNQQNRP